MKRLCSVVLVLIAWAISPSADAQSPSDRLALVIGNANYPDAGGPLPTVLADARLLSEELRRSGFTVDHKENLGKTELRESVDAFFAKIKPGTIALISFSGFGIQVSKQTFLIPVNAQIWSENDARKDSMSLDNMAREMHKKGAKTKILIVDAARKNPFERRFRPVAEGLATVDAPPDSLVILSTGPGNLLAEESGKNSLFMGEFVKELRAPTVSAEEVFGSVRVGVSRVSDHQQIPWVASTLTAPFYFSPAATVPVTNRPKPSPPVTETTKPAVDTKEARTNVTTQATPDAAAPLSVKQVFEKYRLLGTFAIDCGRPASKQNLYHVQRALDDNRIQADQVSEPTGRDFTLIFDRIISTEPDKLTAGGTIGNQRYTVTLLVEGDRKRTMEMTREPGMKVIAAGRRTNNGAELPWHARCAKAG